MFIYDREAEEGGSRSSTVIPVDVMSFKEESTGIIILFH